MPELAPPPPTTLASLTAPGIAAVRRYWKPFLFLQAVAFLMVLGYYTTGPVRLACDRLSTLKEHGGLVFDAIAAAIAGAILPELAKAIMLGDRAITQKRLANVGFALFAFAGAGVIADLQYRAFGWLVGTGTDWRTIGRKILMDQFVTTPSYGTTYWVLVYAIRANRYDLLKTARQLSARWYVRYVLPLLIPAWAFWIPMVALIFSLPGPLQFCLYCFALAAWSLLMVFVATREAEASVEDAA